MDIDFSPFIEYYLDELGCNYLLREGSKDKDYFLCQNPIIEESNPSFLIYTDGYCISYNGNINNKEGLSLKEVCQLTGHFKDYIQFLLDKTNIPTYKLNSYKSILVSKQLKEKYDFKKYKEYKKLFGGVFISENDILQINELTPMKVTKYHKKNTHKKKKSKIIEVEQTEDEYKQCLDYIKIRCLDFIDGRVEPVTLKINSWKVLAIAFRHSNGHTKYRLINSDLKYIGIGSYKTPFVSKCENNNKAILTEGQIESESIKMLEGYDIFGIANTNTLGDIDFLKKYEEVIVLIDNDTFKKVELGIRKKLENGLPNIKIKVLPKYDSNDKSIDFNSTLCKEGKEKLLEYLKKRLDNID